MIANGIAAAMEQGSWIRRMFEAGGPLKEKYGAENVYDFSLGNPDGQPPESVLASMERLVRKPDIHKYMPNAGFADARERIAAWESARCGLTLHAGNVVMAVGAAGGLNVALKALLDPGDEVIVLAPFFVEYLSYIRNHGGVPVVCETDEHFLPVPEAVAAAVSPRTKALILNNPHNPTGVVYSRACLEALAAALSARCAALGREPVCVLSDEPYARLAYDGAEVPPVLALFPAAMVINSFSKSLALPGARIGYIALRPDMPEAAGLFSALAYTTRTLGYVNAPGILQETVAENLDAAVDVAEYRLRRDLLADILTRAGFSFEMPRGAFYIFPKSPMVDDVAFCAKALEQRILVVPGTGFGRPGYFRVAYCVDKGVIMRSAPAWSELFSKM